MMVFGYLLLISTDFFSTFYLCFLLSLVSIEKIYQTLKTVFDCISKHLEGRQKYSAARRIFYSSRWTAVKHRFCVFDVLFSTKLPRQQ